MLTGTPAVSEGAGLGLLDRGAFGPRQRFREAGCSDAPAPGSRPRAAPKGSWAVQPSAVTSLAQALIVPGCPLNPELTALIVPGPRAMRADLLTSPGQKCVAGLF